MTTFTLHPSSTVFFSTELLGVSLPIFVNLPGVQIEQYLRPSHLITGQHCTYASLKDILLLLLSQINVLPLSSILSLSKMSHACVLSFFVSYRHSGSTSSRLWTSYTMPNTFPPRNSNGRWIGALQYELATKYCGSREVRSLYPREDPLETWRIPVLSSHYLHRLEFWWIFKPKSLDKEGGIYEPVVKEKILGNLSSDGEPLRTIGNFVMTMTDPNKYNCVIYLDWVLWRSRKVSQWMQMSRARICKVLFLHATT